MRPRSPACAMQQMFSGWLGSCEQPAWRHPVASNLPPGHGDHCPETYEMRRVSPPRRTTPVSCQSSAAEMLRWVVAAGAGVVAAGAGVVVTAAAGVVGIPVGTNCRPSHRQRMVAGIDGPL